MATLTTEREGLVVDVERPLEWQFGGDGSPEQAGEAVQRPADHVLLFTADKRGDPYYGEAELTPAEARQLAAELVRLADEIEGRTAAMSEVNRILRYWISGTEGYGPGGSFECHPDSVEATEMLARFCDQQPIVLNGRTFRVTGYEQLAYQNSGGSLLVDGMMVPHATWMTLRRETL